MAEPLTDVERVLKLSDRVRLLVAISDEIPVETKLNVQGLLKIFEGTVAAAESAADEVRAAGYYQALYQDLEPYADIEALLSAMRVFAPFL
ncbi:MAG: hypothetical protein HYR72_23605 [Deltaproteobacteria bacterium]|nr:hypothetical protein [Deltaproteobacteria bacterium]MBI3389087.1 hypothetical protein [Deltaproteobacteria bacterium]